MANEPCCPFCNNMMYKVFDKRFPHLTMFLCYRCGFNPNTVIMEDASFYQIYQQFYANFKGILKPKRLLPKASPRALKHANETRDDDDRTEE